jgi:putative glutamine amidotransferase
VSPRRPLIAVAAYALGPDRVARWPEGGYGVPAPYLEALRRAGATTVIVAPGEPETPQEILDRFDGLMLVGGGDVDPAKYGQQPDEHVYGVEPARDSFEIELVLAAERAELPVLSICRGMQVMNIAHGGTLDQHLPDRPELLEHGVPLANTESIHGVDAVEGSRLADVSGTTSLKVSSHHHQGIDELGGGLVVSGRSPDGLIEAIEATDPRGWVLGVQWHPEDTASSDPAQQALFEGLVAAAERRSA